MGKLHLCLDFFRCRHGHAEQRLHHTVRRVLLSGKTQCLSDLCHDLIFTKNPRLQSSCQPEKMLHRLPLFAKYKIRAVHACIRLFYFTELFIEPFFRKPVIRTRPQLHPVAR